MTPDPNDPPGTNLCNVDGAIVAEAEATVPVLDRGFLFGDSIYEVLRTRGGRLLAWREHLDRLRRSADALAMELDLDDGGILRRVLATTARAGFAESYVRIVVTRGTGSAPSIDLRCAPGPLRWVLLVRALPAVEPVARLAMIERLRNDRRALDPAAKSGNYLNNVLGLAESQRTGATDCVFLNGRGHVTEASTSNVFAVFGDRFATPPLGAGLLAGVTRARLIGFLRACGQTVDECDLDAATLRSADELFLTSTLRDIAPVSHLDGRPLHQGGGGGARSTALAAAFAAHLDRQAEVDDAAARRVAGLDPA
ncbi:MAG: aminotransferase class IV [Planctomycetota bacterium]